MKKVVIGIIIMLTGVVLLFNRLGLLDYSIYHLVFSWQTLLIAIGATLLFDKKSDNKNAGVILIFIGAAFLISKSVNANWNGLFLPVLIICAGIFLVIQATTKRKNYSFFGNGKSSFGNMDSEGNFNEMPFHESDIDKNGFIRREYVFTGSKERWTRGIVRRMEIEAVFSGVELDLTQIELSDEVKRVHIIVKSIFSGVILFVPSDWNILLQKTSVFGGFMDKRYFNSQRPDNKEVILELEAVFGGGEIKCYE
ncbi:membrane protein [Bacteroidia bacterium]|nr:membrane protein [Bacteroidia bacterium]GHV71989.1 membrane protein [Bacteroidia bacterium]